MADGDEKRPADRPGPPKSARPNAPDGQRQRSSGSRPGRPDRRSVAARPVAKPAPPVIAETTVIALPPPKPCRPSPFASRTLRQTLLPPIAVSGVGLAVIGAAYFLAPVDAATRQFPPVLAGTVVAAGLLCLGVAALLAASLRR